MMIKSLGGVLCGLLVACGGVVQTPAARVAVIDSCAGTSVRSAAPVGRSERHDPIERVFFGT